MTDYTKTTNFASKDSLPSGNANKIVKGTEIDTEFNNIATASATKADIAGPTFTGTVTIPTADINGGAVDGTTIGASSASSIVGTTIVANTSINIAGDGATVTGIKDEDDMSSNSATKLATQQSIKAYVDSQVTAQDLDVTDGSSSIDIDLDSESLGILGGTGIDSTASGTGVTLAIDSTVATLTGSQTLTNKTLTAPTLTGTAVVASLDISGDVDVDGTLETDALSINGTTVTSTAAELNILDGVTSTAAELNILDGVTSTTAELNILDGVTSTAAELNILDGKAFLDEDDMSSNSATGIASQQSIKAYVDSQVTAQDLDFQADSGGALSIDLDSETLTFTGGTGIDTSGSGNAVTFAIDSTVATLTGSQTLTNKTLTSPDINTPDIDGGTIDGTTIGGSTAAAGTFTTFTSNGIDDNASATALTIDSSGRLGVGDTPNTNWRNDATDDVLMLGTEATLHSDAGVTTELWNNAYVNNSDTFKNISTRGASRYMQYSGAHKWFTAASASAGSTISTEINSSPKMVLDVSGNLGIGTSSVDRNLHIESAGDTYVRVSGNRGNANDLHIGNIEFENSFGSTGVIAEMRAITGNSGTQSSKGQLAFYTDDGSTYAERMRITDGGIDVTGTAVVDQLNIDSASYDNRQLGMDSSGFFIYNSADARYDMVISDAGNVDIGSPAGSEKLSVAGSITADGYVYPTTDNGWSLGLSTNRWGNVYAYNGNFESTVYIGPGGGVSQLQIFPAFTSGVNLIQNYSGSAYTTEEHRAFDYNFKIANLSSALFINASGGIYSGTTGTSIGSGNIVVNEGIYVGAANGNNQIRSSSAGGGSATLYIGNAAIQVSSDQRLKTNIVDTEMDATAKLNQVRVVDFNWDDPSDTSFNNRNARGKWTGVLAQELVDVLPFAVNAPRNESDLSIDTDSEQKWLVDQAQMVPVLIKAIQELTTRIEELENN